MRALDPKDVAPLVVAFAELGWPGKDAALFEGYLTAQARDEIRCLVAVSGDHVAGYVCVEWRSSYAPFAVAGIPEIVDLNVLPRFRRQGLGTALMDAAEADVGSRSAVAGLGVGLYADYGDAWRVYIARGYVPDGRGVMYEGRAVVPGAVIPIDDSAVMMLTKVLRA